MTVIFNPKPAIGFHTTPFKDQHGNSGFSYTLTQKVGEYLREAERRFGERNTKWTILGIEFFGDIPQIWFPYNEKLVSIILTDAASADPNEALFEIAHEVIHLLEPTIRSPTSVFEEGLATLFAHDISVRDGLGRWSSQPSYLAAEKELKDLIALHPDAVNDVRSQLTKRTFFDLTESDILAACPTAPSSLAKTLCEKFVR